MNQSPAKFNFFQTVKKFFISAFVVVTFGLYVVHERTTNADDNPVIVPTDVALAITPENYVSTPTATDVPPTATDVPPTVVPTLTSTPIPPTATSTSKPPTRAKITFVPVTKTTTSSNSPTDTVVPASSTPVAATLTSTPVPPSLTSTPIPPTATQIPPTATESGLYKNGQYTGDVADAFYGNVQVKIAVSGGKIQTVQFLTYPNHRSRSVIINTYAMPILKTEAIQAQNAEVNIVSGATLTSEAFIESLQSALNQAH